MGAEQAKLVGMEQNGGVVVQRKPTHKFAVEAQVTDAKWSVNDGGRAWVCSGTECGSVLIWNAHTGQIHRSLKGHTEAITAVTFDARHQKKQIEVDHLVASSSKDHTARLWSLSSGECVAVLSGHRAEVNDVTFSKESGLSSKLVVSCSSDRTVKVWSCFNYEVMMTLKGHECVVNSAEFSPADGGMKWVVSASNDESVRVWNAETGVCNRILMGHDGPVLSSSFVGDDFHCVVSSSKDTTIKLWDLKLSTCLKTLEGHTDAVNSVQIATADDAHRWAISASHDGTARVWDMELGACVRVFDDVGKAFSASFSEADGGKSWVLTASKNGLMIWGEPNEINTLPNSTQCGATCVPKAENKATH